jgi:hypothetical protein
MVGAGVGDGAAVAATLGAAVAGATGTVAANAGALVALAVGAGVGAPGPQEKTSATINETITTCPIVVTFLPPNSYFPRYTKSDLPIKAGSPLLLN